MNRNGSNFRTSARQRLAVGLLVTLTGAGQATRGTALLLADESSWTPSGTWTPTPEPATLPAPPTLASPNPSTWNPRPVALPRVAGFREPIRNPPPAPAAPTTIVIAWPPAPKPVTPPPAPLADDGPRITRPLPADQRPTPVASAAVASPPPADPVASAARASQWAQTAIDQLRQAHWSARRGAIQSARQSAWETLRTIAAMRDDQVGDARYSGSLRAAQTAIEEAADFTGRFGHVDQLAMKRLIDVHTTAALKDVDSAQLTPARAVESYLDWSRQHLVESVGGGPLASQATMILADLEQAEPIPRGERETPSRQAEFLAAELTLMLRSAALQIDPTNATASAALGRTLLTRSLPAEAIPYLKHSVTVYPTQQNVRDLLTAATWTGDLATATQCEQSLASSPLPSELLVQQLTPAQFAATHATLGRQPAAAPTANPPAAEATAPSDHGWSTGSTSQPVEDVASRIVDPTLPRSNIYRGTRW